MGLGAKIDPPKNGQNLAKIAISPIFMSNFGNSDFRKLAALFRKFASFCVTRPSLSEKRRTAVCLSRSDMPAPRKSIFRIFGPIFLGTPLWPLEGPQPAHAKGVHFWTFGGQKIDLPEK
jgi:hypothetical protein